MKHPGEENHSVWTAERKNQAVPLSKMQCKYKKLSNPLYFLLLLQMIGQQDAKLSIHTEHCSRLQILHLDLALLLRLLKQFFYNRHQFFAYFNRKLIVKFLIFCTMKNGIIRGIPVFRHNWHSFNHLPQCLITAYLYTCKRLHQLICILLNGTVKQCFF